MVTWPTTLSGPFSVSVNLGTNTVSRATQSGRKELRRFGDTPGDIISAVFRVTSSLIPTFLAFYTGTANHGTEWFKPSWLTTMGYSTHACKFLGYPKRRTYGAKYSDFTVNLLVKPTDYIALGSGSLTVAGLEIWASLPAARALFAGGLASVSVDTIDFCEIETLGNASDFGDLAVAMASRAGASSTTRALFAYGFASGIGYVDSIEYCTIATLGNTEDFGDLTVARDDFAGASSSTKALFAGGFNDDDEYISYDTIEYCTIATLGNAEDFGDLTVARSSVTGASSPTRALFAGGYVGSPEFVEKNTIDYCTIATLGNASDFGDLSVARDGPAGGASSTRALFAGGFGIEGDMRSIDYCTIATLASVSDFGDLSSLRRGIGGTSSTIRALFAGGYLSDTIDYCTIATLGNASDFGDLTVARRSAAGASNSHGGLS